MDATVNPRAASLPPVVRYALVVGLLIVFAVAAQVLFAGTRPHRLPPPFGPAANGRIYFDVDGRIVRANADGCDRQTIGLGGNASARYPSSPDGTKFAYVTVDPTQVAGSSVMVADADGSNAHKVSGDLPVVIDPTNSPTWSPDGTQLAFGAFHEGYDRSLSPTPTVPACAPSATATPTAVRTRSGRRRATGSPTRRGRAHPPRSSTSSGRTAPASMP